MLHHKFMSVGIWNPFLYTHDDNFCDRRAMAIGWLVIN